MSTGRRLTLGDTPVTVKICAAIVIAAVVAVLVGLVGLRSHDLAARQTQQMYQRSVLATDLAQEMRVQLMTIRFASLNRGTTTDPAAKASWMDQRNAAHAAYDKAAKDYLNKADPTASQKAVVKKALSGMTEYFSLTAQLDVLMAKGDMATWNKMRSEQVSPLMDSIVTTLAKLPAAQVSEAAAAAATAKADYVRTRNTQAIVLVVGLLIAVTAGAVVARSITGALRRVQASAVRLANGDLSTTSGLDQRDEVGQVARQLDDALVHVRSLVASVVGSADAVASSATSLTTVTDRIAHASRETSAQSGVVSAAAGEVSRSVSTVAAGADEMGISIREIAQNANEAARVAAQAVAAAGTATTTISKLGDSSAEIGNVIKVITSIAEQTNLLALNATIEAARAGEAGKGFAVVASEVKELAQETARATEDIGRRVDAIQADTAGAVSAIAEISSIIVSISDFQTTIASAVEEQTATTSEMSRSVSEAAGGTVEIATNIAGVSSAADATTAALEGTTIAVQELSILSSELRATVARFTV